MNKRALRKFKSMYKGRFGNELSEKGNERRAEKLLQIYAVIYDISTWSKRDLLKINNNDEYEGNKN